MSVTSTPADDQLLGTLTFGDGEGWTPLISKDVKADAAVGVDVGVVDSGGEVDLRRLEGIVCGEVDSKEKDASLIRGLSLDRLMLESDAHLQNGDCMYPTTQRA